MGCCTTTSKVVCAMVDAFLVAVVTSRVSRLRRLSVALAGSLPRKSGKINFVVDYFYKQYIVPNRT